MSIDESNPPDWLLDCLKGPDNPPAWNSASITGEEVRTQLKRMPVSSAPGPDRLPYKVWKAMDPDGELLALIFKICRRERRIPGPWKVSTTVLIYKKGEESLPSNWRPISLQNAIYKLYAAVWVRRFAEWARETGAVSQSQKGFVPGEGCLEHSFLMRSLTEDARRKRKFLHLVFFDLKNAFGSIPHQLLWFSLQRLGLPSEMMDVFRDVYQGSLFKVRSEDGLTDGIPQGRGVKQGCPLSPLLFNAALRRSCRLTHLRSPPSLQRPGPRLLLHDQAPRQQSLDHNWPLPFICRLQVRHQGQAEPPPDKNRPETLQPGDIFHPMQKMPSAARDTFSPSEPLLTQHGADP